MQFKSLLVFCFAIFTIGITYSQSVEENRYYVYDSEDVGGPAVSFIDIRKNGEYLPVDNNSNRFKVNVELDKPFPYFGKSLEKVSVSRYGYISTDLLDNGKSHANYCVLTPYRGNIAPSGGLILAYHTQLLIFPEENSGAWYRYFDKCPRPKDDGTIMGASVFQWRGKIQVQQQFINAQVILYDDGDIVFQYSSDNGLDPAFFTSTVGLINPEKTIFQKYICEKEKYRKLPLAVSFDRRPLPSQTYCTLPNGKSYSNNFSLSEAEGRGVSTINIQNTDAKIKKLSVVLKLNETRVDGNLVPLGNVRFFLQNANTGKNIELLNLAPGGILNFCLGTQIDVLVSDDAKDDAKCNPDLPVAIGGIVKPDQPLAVFKNVDLDGYWRLVIIPDPNIPVPLSGSWCLVPEAEVEGNCVVVNSEFEDFNGGDGGWTVQGNGNQSWEFGKPTTNGLKSTFTGSNTGAWVTNTDGNYNNNDRSSVISPEYNLTNYCSSFVSFDAAFDLETNKDGVTFQASTDGGLTWENVGKFGDANWFNSGALFSAIGGLGAGEQNVSHFSGKQTTRKRFRHDLNKYIGESKVKFRFAIFTDDEVVKEGFFFDNFEIGGTRPDVSNFDGDQYCESDSSVQIVAQPNGGDFSGPGIEGYPKSKSSVLSGEELGVEIPDLGRTEYILPVTAANFPADIKGTNLGTDIILDSLYLNLRQTYVADLQILLVNPKGDTLIVMNRPGITKQNVAGCGFDNIDAVIIPGTGLSIDSFCIDQFIAIENKVTASNKGKGLRSLQTGDAIGDWKLIIIDNSAEDNGTLEEFNIHFTVKPKYFFNPGVAGPGNHTITYSANTFSQGTIQGVGQIEVFRQADAGFEIDSIICFNDGPVQIVPIETGGIFSGTGIIDSAKGIFDPTVAGPGLHTITHIVVVPFDCNDTVITTIRVVYNPIAEAGDNLEACFGQFSRLGGSPTANPDPRTQNPNFYFTYDWKPAKGFVAPNGNTEANPLVNPVETTWYVLTVTDTLGCTDMDSARVFVRNSPIANAGDDQTLCITKELVLGGNPTAEGGTAPYTFRWTTLDGVLVSTLRNPKVSPSVTTTYILNITDNLGCTDADTVLIRVVPNPTVVAEKDTIICAGTTVDVTARVTSGTGPFTYNWSPTIGLSNFTTQVVTITGFTNVIYKVEVTDANGCKGEDFVTINVIAAPIADAGDDHEICNNTEYPIRLGGSPAANPNAIVEWTPIATIEEGQYFIQNPQARPIETTIYTLFVIDPVTGCTASDVARVEVNPAPKIDMPLQFNVCRGESVQIGGSNIVSGGFPAYSYSWFPADQVDNPSIPNPNARPNGNPVFYTLFVTDAKGCTNTGEVVVQTVIPQNASIINLPAEICSNAEPLVLQANPSNGVFTGIGVKGGIFYPGTVTPGQTYTITYSTIDVSNCKVGDTAFIKVNQAPIVTAANDTSIYRLDTAVLKALADIPVSYLWSPSDRITDATSPLTFAFPLFTTTYIITATTEKGCFDTDDMVVFVDENPNPFSNIPNTFTPDEDGINDRWNIKLLQFYPDNLVTIYNRWGQKLFEQAGYNDSNAWTGEDLPEETYFYIIQRSADDANPIRGHISIIRGNK